MKILFVSRWFWEERRRNGGRPGFCGELVEAIAQKGIDLTVLSQSADAGLEPEFRPADGLKVHLFSREKRKADLWPLDKMIKVWAGYRKAATDAAVIRRFIRRHGPFHAVVAQCEEPDGLVCALAVRAGGAWPPLVVQVHDLRYKFGAGTVRFIRKSSLGFIFKKSARVMANSDQTALWLQREYGVPADKIGPCRIHLTQPFLQRAAPGAGRTGEERILFLGALNRKKGPDIFLRAAILLARERPGATFVLAGGETAEDSSFRAILEKLAANPLLAGRLESLGKLEPGAVIEQIGRARLVICPSRIETFSRATVEALALGRPVIISATTGAAHWVTSTGAGAVVPPDDPESLAGAIRAWLARANGPDAGAEIRAELTASRAADDWIREVKRALTSPRSPA